MLNRIIKLYKKNQFREVIASIKPSENNELILELKGMAALQVHMYRLAYEVFDDLVKRTPKGQYYYHLALSAMYTKEYVVAIEAFKESSLEAKFAYASKLNEANCYLQIQDDENAEKLLVNLVQENPKYLEAWLMLLNHYRINSSYHLLKKYLDQSQPYIESHQEWKINYSYLLFNKARYEELINYIKQNRLNSKIPIKSLLAKSYVKLAKFEPASEIYHEIVNEDKTALNYYNLAASYSNLTSEVDLYKAITYAETCLEIDPKYHQAYECQSISFYKMNKLNLAYKKIKKALLFDKKNTDYLYRKATILMKLVRPKKCFKVIKQILKIDNNHSKALRLKGIVKLQIGKIKSAKRNLKKSILVDNKDQRAIAYYSIAKRLRDEEGDSTSIENYVCEYRLDPKGKYSDLNEFNRALAKDIKNHSLLRKEPYGLAARNGYLTDDLFRDDTKAIKYFRKLINEKIKHYINKLPENNRHFLLRHKTEKYRISSWATLVQGDGFIDKHIHEDSWISGAYYCTVPDIVKTSNNHGGYFEHSCLPHDIKLENKLTKEYVMPEEGKLVIFPSYLYHQTIPHVTKDDRISIAFDITPESWR